MTDTLVIELILAIGGGFIVLMVGHWKEHRSLHDKIDTVHHALRDQIDQVWKHMNKD